MKKILAMALSILLVFLWGCTNTENQNTTEIQGVSNHVSSSTLEEIEEKLKLPKIIFDDSVKVNDITKISGEIIIYSIDLEENNISYNIRIAKAVKNADEDISGVYLSGNVNHAIFDSAFADLSPSMNVESSKDGSKAFCQWQGYYFSVSSNKKAELNDFYQTSVKYAKAVISKAVFEMNFIGDDDFEIEEIYDAEDFKIKTLGGDVSITLEGDMVMSLEDALKNGTLSPMDIINKCETDEINGKVKADTIKDGGSKEYYYDDFTVLKLNTLDGDKDLIIGRKGTLISKYYQELDK